MVYWSLKTLLIERTRLLMTALAVAFSFVLVVFFSAVFEGESKQITAYLKQVKADVWVMQKGVSNMHMASSMLWDWKADQIEQLEGVESVSAILFLNAPIKIKEKDWLSYLIGMKKKYSSVGPWSMAKGVAIPDKGEAVIPEVISKITGVQLGDKIALFDKKLRIVGLSKGTFSMASSVVFVSYEDLSDLLESRDQYSYLMVYGKEGVSPAGLVNKIKSEVDKVNVLYNQEFIENDWELAVQMGAEIIQMMTILGTILATLIVAFSSYSLISRKKQELAIAKALGFGNQALYLAALCQSIVIISLGLALSMALAFSLFEWLPSLIPQLNLSVNLQQFTPMLVVSLPVAVVSSLFAVHTVVKVDPVMVFK